MPAYSVATNRVVLSSVAMIYVASSGICVTVRRGGAIARATRDQQHDHQDGDGPVFVVRRWYSGR